MFKCYCCGAQIFRALKEGYSWRTCESCAKEVFKASDSDFESWRIGEGSRYSPENGVSFPSGGGYWDVYIAQQHAKFACPQCNEVH
jgi:hypothetical protein